MKISSVIKLFVFFVAIIISTSCSSVKDRANNSEEGIERLPEKGVVTIGLDERLARFPGVTVSGIGANARVKIQGGTNSFNMNADPLFILDGQSIMGGYAAVYGNVDPNRIKKIKVLKGPDASEYGSRGGNGVVIITTK